MTIQFEEGRPNSRFRKSILIFGEDIEIQIHDSICKVSLHSCKVYSSMDKCSGLSVEEMEGKK